MRIDATTTWRYVSSSLRITLIRAYKLATACNKICFLVSSSGRLGSFAVTLSLPYRVILVWCGNAILQRRPLETARLRRALHTCCANMQAHYDRWYQRRYQSSPSPSLSLSLSISLSFRDSYPFASCTPNAVLISYEIPSANDVRYKNSCTVIIEQIVEDVLRS